MKGIINIKKKFSNQITKSCFDKLRLNTLGIQTLKSNLALHKLKHFISFLISIKKRQFTLLKHQCFEKWKNQITILSIISKIKEQNEKKLLLSKNELEVSKKKISELESLSAKQDSKICELDANEKVLNKKIKEKEESERKLLEKIEKLGKKVILFR